MLPGRDIYPGRIPVSVPEHHSAYRSIADRCERTEAKITLQLQLVAVAC